MNYMTMAGAFTGTFIVPAIILIIVGWQPRKQWWRMAALAVSLLQMYVESKNHASINSDFIGAMLGTSFAIIFSVVQMVIAFLINRAHSEIPN